jgi:hypothetical protein
MPQQPDHDTAPDHPDDGARRPGPDDRDHDHHGSGGDADVFTG